MPIAAAVLAHQGGWDEALRVLVPIALIVLLVKVANDRVTRRRATRAHGAGAQADASPPTDQPATPTGPSAVDGDAGDPGT